MVVCALLQLQAEMQQPRRSAAVHALCYSLGIMAREMQHTMKVSATYSQALCYMPAVHQVLQQPVTFSLSNQQMQPSPALRRFQSTCTCTLNAEAVCCSACQGRATAPCAADLAVHENRAPAQCGAQLLDNSYSLYL